MECSKKMIIEKCQNVVVKVEIWLSADKVSRGHLPIVKIPSKNGKIARSRDLMEHNGSDGVEWHALSLELSGRNHQMQKSNITNIFEIFLSYEDRKPRSGIV